MDSVSMVVGAIRKPRFLGSFSRSQASSLMASVVDYGLIFFLTEYARVYYVASVAIGAFAGAVTNFLVNRHWSFTAAEGRWEGQALRYSLVSGGSLLLNTAGVYFVTETFRIHYAISVFAVSLSVGWFYNYPLQRHFVFTQKAKQEKGARP